MRAVDTHKHTELVKKFIKFYNAFEVEEMVALFTEDCIFQNVSNSSGTVECHGKDALLNMAKQGAEIFSERHQTVTNWVIADEKIAIEIDYRAILAIDFPNGSLKKGDVLNLKGVSIYEFEDNKIKRLVDFS